MNPNNLPFMRSLHNMARPHQFLRNNHPVGGSPHMGTPMQQPAPAAGITPVVHHAIHGMAPMASMAQSMAHAPRHGFAQGGQVPAFHRAPNTYAMGGLIPSMDELSNVDVTQAYPYDAEQGFSYSPSDVDSLNQLANTSVLSSPDMSSVGQAPDIGAYDPTISSNNPELQQYSADISNQGGPVAPKMGGFMGLSGKDWLNIGMNALGGLMGHSPSSPNVGARSVGIMPPQARLMARSAHSGYAQGGQVQAPPPQMAPQGQLQQGQPQGQPQGDPKQLIMAAAAVIAGQSNDQGALQAFVQRFGQAELQHLVQVVKSGQLKLPQQGQPQGQPQQPQQMPPAGAQAPQNGMAMGGLVQGPGNGTSDSVPAVHAPTGQPIALSGEEYIVPAAVVSALGNGSSKAGAQKIAAGIATVRRHKGMPVRGNQPNLGPNDNPLFSGR